MALERDDFILESSSRSRFLFEHDLFRKPLHTFRDHALGWAKARDRIASAAEKSVQRRAHAETIVSSMQRVGTARAVSLCELRKLVCAPLPTLQH
jgi:hypothetical protein